MNEIELQRAIRNFKAKQKEQKEKKPESNFAKEYRKDVKQYSSPPPCIHCSDVQIESCARSIQDCKKFDQYVKEARSSEFPSSHFLYYRAPKPQTQEQDDDQEPELKDSQWKELDLDELALFQSI